MNSDHRHLVHRRLVADELIQAGWISRVLAACDSQHALAEILSNNNAVISVTEKPTATKGTGAYLTSLAVEGWGGAALA